MNLPNNFFFKPDIFNFTLQSKTWCSKMSVDDIYELEPPIATHCICPRCLKTSRSKHIYNCHPIFTRPVFQKLSRLILQITQDSPETEKLICERISKASVDCKGIPKQVLRKWTKDMQVFLLTVDEEITSYIVMGGDVVLDIFTVLAKRGIGNMRFLLFNTLESMNLKFEDVWFKEPLCETEWHFLESVSEQTGLKFKTYGYFL
jgi:hypothetical protein